MADRISNEEVENTLREILDQEGFDLSPVKAFGETGTDVIATKNAEIIHIEVIGYKQSGPARATDFYQVFFRAVSRLNLRAKNCVIALPIEFARGLPARVNQHRVAWERIGTVFPEVEIWLVDVEAKTYEKTAWNDWLNRG